MSVGKESCEPCYHELLVSETVRYQRQSSGGGSLLKDPGANDPMRSRCGASPSTLRGGNRMHRACSRSSSRPSALAEPASRGKSTIGRTFRGIRAGWCGDARGSAHAPPPAPPAAAASHHAARRPPPSSESPAPRINSTSRGGRAPPTAALTTTRALRRLGGTHAHRAAQEVLLSVIICERSSKQSAFLDGAVL
jgi:hypothetical protein